MNKLSKEKRNQFILAVLLTAVVAAGLWFGLISNQRAALAKVRENIIPEKQQELTRKRQEIKGAKELIAQAIEATNKIAKIEEEMPVASGDLFAWMVQNLRMFKLPYKIDIQQTVLDQPSPKPVDILPKFPYQQAKFKVAGNAYYHDFGKFIADLENHFPYFRVLNIDLAPEQANEKATAAEREKLSFTFDVIILVKPNAS